ncbi:MAG: MliC family protein [Pseudomonadota bacterium]
MILPGLAVLTLASGAVLGQTAPAVATVGYACAHGKSLSAQYFQGPSRTAADGRPIPGGRVVLTLDDGRRLTLPQTLSGSGIRYANADETVVFWSRGDTAFIEEGPGHAVSYEGCRATKK